MSNAIGYRASKAGANMVAICLQEALVDRNILVWPFHPGYVKTRMTGHADGAIPVEESANGPFFFFFFFRCIFHGNDWRRVAGRGRLFASASRTSV